jgi:3-hydroxyisobutyrate dehydrogenase-like beta-hydroxyacid dehydrogenase
MVRLVHASGSLLNSYGCHMDDARGPGTGTLRIAVLGLGEAGGLVAYDLLAAGADVTGYDPRIASHPHVRTVGGEACAARGCDVVLALTAAKDAPTALRNALPGLAPGTLYADLSTGSDSLKRALADECATVGGLFADVALMAPVPGLGLRTPMLVSGGGAERFRSTLQAFGAHVTTIDGGPGEAARRKLLRSVFYKGMAAALVEAHEAAHAAGLGDWLLNHVAEDLAGAHRGTAIRLLEGSRTHAVRREAEMAAAAEVVRGLGVPAPVTEAARAVLHRLAAEDTEASGGRA